MKRSRDRKGKQKDDAPVDVSVLLEVGEAEGTEAAQHCRVPHRRPVLDAGPHLPGHGNNTVNRPCARISCSNR